MITITKCDSCMWEACYCGAHNLLNKGHAIICVADKLLHILSIIMCTHTMYTVHTAPGIHYCYCKTEVTKQIDPHIIMSVNYHHWAMAVIYKISLYKPAVEIKQNLILICFNNLRLL